MSYFYGEPPNPYVNLLYYEQPTQVINPTYPYVVYCAPGLEPQCYQPSYFLTPPNQHTGIPPPHLYHPFGLPKGIMPPGLPFFGAEGCDASQPYRNTCTNLGNQIVNFACVRKKSIRTLERLVAGVSVEEVDNYYKFTVRLRKAFNGYLNMKKLQKLWTKQTSSLSQERYHAIFIRLCQYYIDHMSIPALLTSRKLNKQKLQEHLAMRRVMIRLIRRAQ